jgi:hypothetical protein
MVAALAKVVAADDGTGAETAWADSAGQGAPEAAA